MRSRGRRVRLTRHLAIRCVEREIPAEAVAAVLEAPDFQGPAKDGARWAARALLVDGARRWVTVVFVDEARRRVVLTAYGGGGRARRLDPVPA